MPPRRTPREDFCFSPFSRAKRGARGDVKLSFRGWGAPGWSSRSAMMPLAAGSELGDELLGLVQLAAEPVPLLGRAPRERLARVAGVQPADRGHALPLPGPELRDGRRPLRRASSAFPSQSRPHESNLRGPVPRPAGRQSAGPLAAVLRRLVRRLSDVARNRSGGVGASRRVTVGVSEGRSPQEGGGSGYFPRRAMPRIAGPRGPRHAAPESEI